MRVDIAPAFGFYSINKNHAQDARPKLSAAIGFKKEFRLGNEFRTYFLIGVDYFFHGLSFKSYYFNPDSLKLYDKSFGYTYSLFIHEIDIPFQFKYLLKREDNGLYSPYVSVAYHIRYLLPGTLKVKQNGEVIKSDDMDLKFKNSLFSDKINAFVSAGIGWQKNHLSSSSRGSFFAELNFKYGFSSYYFQKDYAANSLYINGAHLSLQLGLKF